MLRFLRQRLITRFEAVLGVGLPYLRHIERHRPGLMLPIGLSMPAMSYGSHMPFGLLHLVRLGATIAQDCGECLQIAVNMAARDGLAAETIRTALRGDADGFEATAFAFGRQLGLGLDAPEERDAIRKQWGEQGLIEAANAAASALFFPALKRGLGFAEACNLQSLHIPVRAA